MRRFFTDIDIDTNYIFLSAAESHHIKNVLRLKKNDGIIICDRAGAQYAGQIDSLDDQCGVKILSLLKSIAEPSLKLTLCQCLPKGDKLELIIQKCTELGISRIIPVASSRCVSRPDNKDAEKKTARWQKIAAEASKQCGRSVIPEIARITPLHALTLPGRRLFAYELENAVSLTDKPLKNEQEASLLIGPEGGFETAEAERLIQNGWEPVSLGPRILRTETASIAAVSIIMALAGCMDVVSV